MAHGRSLWGSCGPQADGGGGQAGRGSIAKVRSAYPGAGTTRGRALSRGSRSRFARGSEVLGQARAEDEVRSVIERLAASITEINQYRSHVLRQTEADAVRLAIAIARRVLRRELTVDPAAIEGSGESRARRGCNPLEGCRVRMHPDYVPALRVSIDKFGMSGKVER